MIEYVDECHSTQNELIEAIRYGVIKPPYTLVAKSQSLGIGSRGNSWESAKGNLYFSFAVDEETIANDIPSPSMSIYFSCLMSMFLQSLGSKIWVKWPNDFYIDDKKIGGVITTKIKKTYICGMGINLVKSPSYSTILDIEISSNEVVCGFLELLEKRILWKQIFSKFSIEFEKSKEFDSHIADDKISLKSAILCEDGAILINNKKVYSLR